MPQNVTLRIEGAVLKKGRHAAVEQNKSLAKWVAGLIIEKVTSIEANGNAKKNAIAILETGPKLGERKITREDLYER